MRQLNIFKSLISLIFLFLSVNNAQASLWDSDSTVGIAEINKTSSQPVLSKNKVTLRLAGYVDERVGIEPNQFGISNQLISGISGKKLVIDAPVKTLVAAAMKQRFAQLGYQIVDSVEQPALYELSGVIKEFVYNVKERDEVAITVESTLKEVSTGAVIWSGVVVEKASRFAGVGGNNKKDVIQYLRKELTILTQKTVNAIGASLAAVRPELFNLTPGTQQIEGVVVLQAARGNAFSANSAANGATNGTLALTTQPSRAKIYVDGIYFGLSPLRAELSAGVHRISIKLDNFKTQEEQVSLRSGQVTELEMPFEAAHP